MKSARPSAWGGATARGRASGWRRGRARGERRLRVLVEVGGEEEPGRGGQGERRAVFLRRWRRLPTKEEEGGEGGWSKLGVGVGASRSGSPRTVGERPLLLEVVGSGTGPVLPLPPP